RIQLMDFGLFADASRGQSTTCNPSRSTESPLFVSSGHQNYHIDPRAARRAAALFGR
ncbi:hypothetical protein F442_22849, partial [Phytophthora nicotianae P10297]